MIATVPTEVIGKVVLPVEKWNPRAVGNADQFTYIDISSIDSAWQKTPYFHSFC